ncbi:uncharacterized protein LOC103873895 [Brassica rapa]|uniref:uncharacterized protein LOC103873895 n=1 Tax=Brassica campestris TaxID=3711 RepID=UPI0004F1945F|nr:uncharacterized protein LOC103873895 [Brassica rapa]
MFGERMLSARLCSPLEKALSPPAFLFPVSSSGAQPLLHRRSAFSPPGHLSLSAGKLLSLSNSGQLLASLSRWSSQILVVKKDKAIEKEITNLSRNKSGASSEVSKLDTSSLVASDVNTPEIFDVQTRNDLEYVKIPRDSKVKTPETPKAKEAEDQEVSFSENWEVKFPEELEATKTSEVFKVADQSKLQQVSKVSAPKLSQVKVKKEPDVPEVLDDRSVTEVLEVHAPSEVSGIKVS